MNRFTILKKEYIDDVLYLQLQDSGKNNFIFWIECGLIDGYGNTTNYKTNDLYINWAYNQYIFFTNDEADICAKEYQENVDNADAITNFIDDINNNLVKDFLKNIKKGEI